MLLTTRKRDMKDVKANRSASIAPGGEVRNEAENAKVEDEYTRYRAIPSPANNGIKLTRTQQDC